MVEQEQFNTFELAYNWSQGAESESIKDAYC